MSFFLTCKDVVPRLTDFQEGALPWFQSFRFRLHLSRCQDCRKIHTGLLGLPELLRTQESLEVPPQAHAALVWAMEHLGQAPQHSELPATPIPQAIQEELKKHDNALLLQERVHKALFKGLPRMEEPFISEAALAELPPMEKWSWKRLPFSRIRVATLMEEAGNLLMVMVAPPQYRYPAHAHLGAESVLVLDGELEEEGKHLSTGDWAYYPPGSSHGPLAGEDGCWTLVRLEGGFRHEGMLGRIRDWLS